MLFPGFACKDKRFGRNQKNPNKSGAEVATRRYWLGFHSQKYSRKKVFRRDAMMSRFGCIIIKKSVCVVSTSRALPFPSTC